MDYRQKKALVIAVIFGILLTIAILCVYLNSPKEKGEEKSVAEVDVPENVNTGGTSMSAFEIVDETAYISEDVAAKKE
ncbi:hypothetical protein [Peribacillus huizhouensis]|uniref:Uncharacterized protein n=1 Tax=Peribacillus huizhouensis TaxID=1501239 RepID=A0ABR6CKS8_9BACI|nr:hypothetical protein [Peribacillus huizhouensis]MBA9025592.1 hypothetical protein [Peribacillus huizhouensis]